MRNRWRGRSAGLAIIAILLALPLAVAAAGRGVDPALVVRDPAGEVLHRVALPAREFALSYRNSLYRSLAEERYAVADDGRLVLEQLAADELAVLEEYYAIDEPAARSPNGRWEAEPAREVSLDRLVVAATDLGRRTLLVEGRPPIELWRLVEDPNPSVTLEVEG